MTKLGQSWDECPRKWIAREVPELMWWIADLGFLRDHHVMPRAGGRLDQDPRWLDAIDVITHESETTRRLLAGGGVT